MLVNVEQVIEGAVIVYLFYYQLYQLGTGGHTQKLDISQEAGETPNIKACRERVPNSLTITVRDCPPIHLMINKSRPAS